MTRLTVLAIALVSAASAACFPDGKDGAPGPAGPPGVEEEIPASDDGAGGAAASSSGDPSSSSSSSSGGDPSSSGGAPTTTKMGTITVIQSSSILHNVQTNSFSAVASFVEIAGTAPAGSKCTTTKQGECDITACDVPNGGAPPAGEAKKSPSASDITITGAEAITLKADAKGAYTPKVGQSQLLGSGTDFKVKAKGKEVPAFEKTVKAPSIVTVTFPEWPDPDQLFNVDRALDLDFTWNDGTVGDVRVTINAITDEKITTCTCKFKADKGAGKIPKAALSKLVASETSLIQVDSVSTQTFDQAGWKINVDATSVGRAAVGGLTTGLAGVR